MVRPILVFIIWLIFNLMENQEYQVFFIDIHVLFSRFEMQVINKQRESISLFWKKHLYKEISLAIVRIIPICT